MFNEFSLPVFDQATAEWLPDERFGADHTVFSLLDQEDGDDYVERLCEVSRLGTDRPHPRRVDRTLDWMKAGVYPCWIREEGEKNFLGYSTEKFLPGFWCAVSDEGGVRQEVREATASCVLSLGYNPEFKLWKWSSGGGWGWVDLNTTPTQGELELLENSGFLHAIGMMNKLIIPDWFWDIRLEDEDPSDEEVVEEVPSTPTPEEVVEHTLCQEAEVTVSEPTTSQEEVSVEEVLPEASILPEDDASDGPMTSRRRCKTRTAKKKKR